jgi:hypothetical protein
MVKFKMHWPFRSTTGGGDKWEVGSGKINSTRKLYWMGEEKGRKAVESLFLARGRAQAASTG